jgi:hypothetical protein
VTNGIKLGAVALMALSALLGGCDDKKASDEKPAASEKDTKKKDAKDAKEEKDDAEEKEAKEAPASDAMTVADLSEKFKADEKAWIGKEVTVRGAYMNSNFVKTGGENKLNNVVVVPKKGEMNPSITCETSDEASVEGLKQYDEVTITGKVRKRFSDPSLEECKVGR